MTMNKINISVLQQILKNHPYRKSIFKIYFIKYSAISKKKPSSRLNSLTIGGHDHQQSQVFHQALKF